MPFELLYTDRANEALDTLQAADEKKFAKVRKTLGLMETNLNNQGLQTHEYHAISGPMEKKFGKLMSRITPPVPTASFGITAPVAASSPSLT